MKSDRPSGLGLGVIRASAGVMALAMALCSGCFYRRRPPEYGGRDYHHEHDHDRDRRY
jgi:hypothetical protein